MAYYRLYCLSGDGRISAAEEIEAATDDEAIVLARRMEKPTTCELWQRDKLVATIPPKPELERPKH